MASMVTRSERCVQCGKKALTSCPLCRQPTCIEHLTAPCERHHWPPRPELVQRLREEFLAEGERARADTGKPQPATISPPPRRES